tara:strand:+ start:419 stop:1222 length:804 start_codon:yes stop_codon:yes gene_type:complete
MKKLLYLLLLTHIICLISCSSGKGELTPETGIIEETDDEENIWSHPDISTFQDNPSDQFLVDFSAIVDGHMYKGQNANKPHSGGHVYFDISSVSSFSSPSDYPKIYAIASGVVSRIDTYFPVHADFTHYRYGIDLTFAIRDGDDIRFHYSIEPFVDPSNNTFYTPYILVNEGDSVQKGDVIAYMYLAENENAHIHFNLYRVSSDGSSIFQAPILFTSSIMNQFLERISTENGGTRNFDEDDWMEDCMGYKIGAFENPFEDVASDCLE